MTFFTHPRETWTKAQCEKIAKHFTKDGLGTKNPWPGQIAAFGSPYVRYGSKIRYNGGCVRNGEWYDGEEMPLPKIPKSFKFVTRSTWGIYLEKI
jgi:hypothetical protein